MQGARALGLSFALPLVLLGCRMDNPAFEDDEFADELGDERTTDESGESESGESGSAEGTESSTDTSSDDATSTSSSDDATSTSTSDDASSESETETETGLICEDGLMDCGGVCVDLDGDPLNCGGCGSLCADNELCVGTCSPKKYVFVSSELRTGAMGGIVGADQFCNGLADAAGLPGDYLAWNSTDLSYPEVDFVKEGVYVRTDGQIVATSYEDLTDGTIAIPINLDENQVAAGVLPLAACPNIMGPVWSNTTSLGEYAGGSACTSWVNGTNLASGKVGRVTGVDGSWTNVDDCNIPCGAFLPIYCVQQNP